MPTLFEPWLQFKHLLVRQLAFAIASPNIIRNIPADLSVVHDFALHNDMFWFEQFEHYLPRLKQLDACPDELTHFIQRLKSTRLGLRFEYLMWFWLQDPAQTQFDIIGHSVQMIDGPLTIGELDFLLWNKQANRVEHWEVALKFYLAEFDLEFANWYGLNRSDTLKRKLNHFTQKQFQFERVLDQDIAYKYAVLKGQLYLPISLEKNENHSSTGLNKTLPDWVNPSRRIGFWGESIKQDFYRVERQEWICPSAVQTSPPAHWWCDGLYKNTTTQSFYMFRQANIHNSYVRVM